MLYLGKLALLAISSWGCLDSIRREGQSETDLPTIDLTSPAVVQAVDQTPSHQPHHVMIIKMEATSESGLRESNIGVLKILIDYLL